MIISLQRKSFNSKFKKIFCTSIKATWTIMPWLMLVKVELIDKSGKGNIIESYKWYALKYTSKTPVHFYLWIKRINVTDNFFAIKFEMRLLEYEMEKELNPFYPIFSFVFLSWDFTALPHSFILKRSDMKPQRTFIMNE